MEKPDVTVGIMSCSECTQHNLAMIVLRSLQGPFKGWRKFNPASIYEIDKETGVIIVDEAKLMRLIQLANPLQRSRPIRLKLREEEPTHPPVTREV